LTFAQPPEPWCIKQGKTAFPAIEMRLFFRCNFLKQGHSFSDRIFAKTPKLWQIKQSIPLALPSARGFGMTDLWNNATF
jgi:hypothetical protein